MMRPFIGATAAAALLVSPPHQQSVTFRTAAEAVAVNVSVKQGARPVPGLTTADFRLYDNGVPQSISELAIEAVPVDVTLFLDTSGSTITALQRMADAVTAIARNLRTTDRLRVLTIGLSVFTAVPWRQVGEPIHLTLTPTPGISLIYDAITTALAHQVPPGRRHLVIALTDGEDSCSVVSADGLRAAASRANAVLHWVRMSGSAPISRDSIPAWCPHPPTIERDPLSDAAEQTGGRLHGRLFQGDPVRVFAAVYEEFRQSYVLYYSPTGVKRRGWHSLRVEVPKGRYTVTARRGYFGQP